MPDDKHLPPVTAPAISVLIPAYNEEELIGRVLDRVHASFAEVGWTSYEIVVCDNNSTDRTGEIAAAKGAVVVPEPHNQIARARNTAAKNARGKWFIFLDGDSFLPAGTLRDTIAALEGGRICAGGSVMQFDKDNLGWFASLLFNTWTRISIVFNLAAGSYIFCYREAWKDVGGFDEEIYAGEELYFSQSLKAWAKKRKLKFKILSGTPIITSSRKMEWYNSWELFLQVMKMSLPGSMRKKAACDLWYTRPGESSQKP